MRLAHPRLIPRSQLPPRGWSREDTLYVVLMLAAVALCALIPLVMR